MMDERYLFGSDTTEYAQLVAEHEEDVYYENLPRKFVDVNSFAELVLEITTFYQFRDWCWINFYHAVHHAYKTHEGEWYEGEWYELIAITPVYRMSVVLSELFVYTITLELNTAQYEKMSSIFTPKDNGNAFEIFEYVLPSLTSTIRVETIDTILSEI